MILQTESFREKCTIIKNAIDNKNVSLYSETLELVASGTTLELNVTNREYFTTTKFNLDEETTFKASVNCKLFVDLISKITSPTIEITATEKTLHIKGNGAYKLPLIYDNDTMLELPKITISNVTNTMTISSSILQNILVYNSKELQRGKQVKPVQSYYYIDEKGCITFTSGACVNSFTLAQPIKMLLSEKVVKLFKLFKDVEYVNFKVGQDPLNENIIQTKVQFESPDVVLTAILPDSGLISDVPVDAIRGMSTKEYPYSAVVLKDELLQTINRLMLFNNDKNYGNFYFKNGSIEIHDWSDENVETITTSNECPSLETYSTIVNLNNLNLILSGVEDDYVTICFGDERALVIKKSNINDIIPELKRA